MNEKHKLFVEEWLINGMNASAAYQKIYPNVNELTARANGARLLAKDNIKEFINSKQQETSTRNNITKDQILTVVFDIMSNAPKHSDRLKASEILLKALGMNMPEKTEISGGMENKIIKIKYKSDED
jgi:phage terminase small subunit